MDLSQIPQGPQGQDPSQQSQPDRPSEVAVTITKEADGTFTVAPETDEDQDQAGPESQATEGQEASQSQTAQNIDQALQIAKSILTGNPAMQAQRSQVAQEVFGQ